MNDCTCPLAGFCSRHGVQKTNRMVHLCRNRQDYWQAWEEGRGPGQMRSTKHKVAEDPETNPGSSNYDGKVIIKRNTPTAWDAIHSYLAEAIRTNKEWIPEKEIERYRSEWVPTIPQQCGCKGKLPEIESKIKWDTAYSAFVSFVDIHNDVSKSIKKPAMSLLEAVGRYKVPVTKRPRVIVVYADECHQKVMNYTRPYMHSYAQRCNADYVELTGVFHHKWAMCDKYRMSNIAWSYDQALLLDSDIVITSKAPNIFEQFNDFQFAGADEIPHYGNFGPADWWHKEARQFYESQGVEFMPTTGINAGVMLFNDTPTMTKIYAEPELPYPKFWCMEQFWLWYQLRQINHVLIDQKWNWAYIRKDFVEKLSQAYFIHFNGLKDMGERLAVMESLEHHWRNT